MIAARTYLHDEDTLHVSSMDARHPGSAPAEPGGRGASPSRPPFADPGWRGLALLGGLAALGLGTAVAALSFPRGSVDELAGGVAITLLSACLIVWTASTTRPPTLPVIATAGWLLQIVATLAYYFGGFALDASRYHGDGVAILEGRVPIALSLGDWATDMVGVLVSLLYRVTGPSQLLGFVTFAAIALVARIMLAQTLLRLRSTLGRPADIAAIAIVTLPSLAWWLAAISKETFSLLGISLVLMGIARPPDDKPRIGFVLTGLAATALTRPHVTLLLAIAVVSYMLTLNSSPQQPVGRRIGTTLASLVLAFGAVNLAAAFLGVAPSLDGLQGAHENVSSISDPGRSNIEQRPIRSPGDVPNAIATVLLRPHLAEANSAPSMMQALETTLLVLLALWLVAQRQRRRRHPLTGPAAQRIRALRAFVWVYTAGFVYTFSGTFNLGLMSRQRSQVLLPLALLAATSFVAIRRRAPESGDRNSAQSRV